MENPWLARRVMGWAHRGGADEGPENTVEAMGTALQTGIHALECDVHLTTDDRLVVHHNPDVVGTHTVKKIATSTLAELMEVKGDLATLDQVLSMFPGVPLTVEVKKKTLPQTAIRTAQTLQPEVGTRPLIVASFSKGSLAAMKAEAPDLDTAPGTFTVMVLWTLRIWSAARGHVALMVPLRLDQVPFLRSIPGVRRIRVASTRFIAAAHAHGLAVHVWTVNDPAEMRVALDGGADGIMTDRPSVLMEVLRQRGDSWPGEGGNGPTGSH